jgi:hypothetical protein
LFDGVDDNDEVPSVADAGDFLYFGGLGECSEGVPDEADGLLLFGCL